MSSPASSPDSFLEKTTAQLQYLTQHPEMYHEAVVAEARRELQRRGALTPHPAATAASAPDATAEVAYLADGPASGRRWWPAVAAGLVALAGLGWWGLRDTPPAAPAASARQEPIVLEAVKAHQLPDFERQAAGQVAQTRRLLPAADRADTTAAGRYARMARRYWLAENTAAYLTAQAMGDSVTAVFPGQVTIALERIDWFMGAKAYNQHLTPTMEARLTLMQQGLSLRRIVLENFKTRYERFGEVYTDRDQNRGDFEAADIGGQLLGQPSKRAPMKGNITDL